MNNIFKLLHSFNGSEPLLIEEDKELKLQTLEYCYGAGFVKLLNDQIRRLSQNKGTSVQIHAIKLRELYGRTLADSFKVFVEDGYAVKVGGFAVGVQSQSYKFTNYILNLFNVNLSAQHAPKKIIDAVNVNNRPTLSKPVLTPSENISNSVTKQLIDLTSDGYCNLPAFLRVWEYQVIKNINDNDLQQTYKNEFEYLTKSYINRTTELDINGVFRYKHSYKQSRNGARIYCEISNDIGLTEYSKSGWFEGVYNNDLVCAFPMLMFNNDYKDTMLVDFADKDKSIQHANELGLKPSTFKVMRNALLHFASLKFNPDYALTKLILDDPNVSGNVRLAKSILTKFCSLVAPLIKTLSTFKKDLMFGKYLINAAGRKYTGDLKDIGKLANHYFEGLEQVNILNMQKKLKNAGIKVFSNQHDGLICNKVIPLEIIIRHLKETGLKFINKLFNKPDYN